MPHIISNTNYFPLSSTCEFPESVENSANSSTQENCTRLSEGVQNLNKDDSSFATLETIAKPLPPPSRSTFYVPTTKSNSGKSVTMSATEHQMVMSTSGPSSPLGEVADTVISGTMAGVHAVIGVPSAVSSLPIYDGVEAVTNMPEERRQTSYGATSNDSRDMKEPQWSCSECTFLNHPALKECEECEMPRVMIGTDLHRVHQAKSCFCHPQDGQIYNPPSLPSLPVQHPITSNNFTTNTFQKHSNKTNTSTENDAIQTELRDELKENFVTTGVTNDSSNVSIKLKETLDRDDSSESASCT